MSTQVDDVTGLDVRPDLPRVNLLPPEIGERRRFRRMQFLAGGAACVALALVAGGYVVESGAVTNARTDLQATQVQQQAAQRRVDAYNYVVQTNDLVDARQQLLAKALTGDVHWSQYLNEFSLHTPSGVWLTHLNVAAPVENSTTPAAPESLSGGSSSAPADATGSGTGSTSDAAAATGTSDAGSASSSTTRPAIATISFEGEALHFNDVSLWLESLTKDPAYTDPFVTEVSEDVVGKSRSVKFTGTVTVTDAALVQNPAGN